MLAPPIKIYRGGALQEDLIALVLNQVRMPHWNRSDLNAIVAACRTAERRVIEMCDRFGVERFISAMEASLERNRRAMAELIKRSIPEEEMVFEDLSICVMTDAWSWPVQIALLDEARGGAGEAGLERDRSAIRRLDKLLSQREHVPDVFRHLHDHDFRPANSLQRRLL